MIRIIGLVGLKQSGKSTALEAIKSVVPAQELQLAKHLKDVCSKVFDIYRPDFDDQDFKEMEFGYNPSKSVERSKHRSTPVVLTLGHIIDIMDLFEIPLTPENIEKARKHVGVVIKTPRFAAQYVGTEIARSFDPDIHINITLKKADPSFVGVVSDIRFPNEFSAFSESKNFISLFIRRESMIPADLANQHESEKHVLNIGEKCSYKIKNDGDKKEFIEAVKEIIKKELKND